MVSACILAALGTASEKALMLRPRLTAGLRLEYSVRYHEAKKVKTESPVTSADQPRNDDATSKGTLRITVLAGPDGDRSGAVLRAEFLPDPANPAQKSEQSAAAAAKGPSPAQSVQFRVLPDGTAGEIPGLDALPTDQQRLFQQWLNLFTSYAQIPAAGVRAGQKWNSDVPETAAAPIAGLVWERAGEYVRDEPCPTPSQVSPAIASPAKAKRESCAVLLIHAKLKQKSSTKDSTPEEYRLHNMKTTGTAQGENETILYISPGSGLVLRASDEAQQKMEVTISLTDGTNRVHYDISANSRTDLLLLPGPGH